MKTFFSIDIFTHLQEIRSRQIKINSNHLSNRDGHETFGSRPRPNARCLHLRPRQNRGDAQLVQDEMDTGRKSEKRLTNYNTETLAKTRRRLKMQEWKIGTVENAKAWPGDGTEMRLWMLR